MAEVLSRNGSGTAKSRLGGFLPVDIPGPGNVSIDLGQTLGQACRGLPGDPQWAQGCQCQCGQLVATAGGFAPCEALYPITRHDIFVETTQECLGHGLNP